MSIRYRIVQNKMRGTANFGKWCGRAVIFDEVSTKELATEISHSTTVTYADVLAVLTELSRQMSVHLQNSQRVVLDGVGAFKVGLRTNLTEKSDSFTLANIKGYHIVYTPESRFVPKGYNAKGHRTGSFVKSLLEGITAKELTDGKKKAGKTPEAPVPPAGH